MSESINARKGIKTNPGRYTGGNLRSQSESINARKGR